MKQQAQTTLKAEQSSSGAVGTSGLDDDRPSLTDWLTLLQTNHDKSIDEQVKNIDAAESAILADYIPRATVLEARIKVYREIVDNWEHSGFKQYIMELYDNDLKALKALTTPLSKGGEK